MIDPTKDTVLITGAAGAIGTALRNGLRAGWPHLRLTDARPIKDPAPNEEVIVADVGDRAAIEQHDARRQCRRASDRRRRGLLAGGFVPGQRPRRVRCVRKRAARRRATDRLRQQQPRLRLLSDHGAGLAGHAASAGQPVRRVQGVWRDDPAQLLRPARHTVGLDAHWHLSHAADRSALAGDVAQSGRRGAAG